MRQIALALGSDAAPSFDSFVVAADANAAAVQQLRALAAGSPPLYLWGPPGSGKTHLLRALAGQWQQRDGAPVGWFDDDDGAAPASPATSGALLVLDGCERYDAAQQHAAFRLFVDAIDAGAAVAAAGRLPPVDLPLRDDLRTRLGWGPVFALQPLAEAEIRAALRRDAGRRGLGLPDELLDHLLTRHARDLGSLMSLLDRLDGYALENKRALTVPLLRRMLSEEVQ